MKVIVFGGDGFCGWPASLYLARSGFDVMIVDNLSRRAIDIELGIQSLTPIKPIHKRLDKWAQISNKPITFVNLNIAEQFAELTDLLREWQPDAIVHFAEQRAAPYSMKSSWHKRYTFQNNLIGTTNLLTAMVEAESKAHLVHLGTMGVYGYDTLNVKIPEGYLTVKVEDLFGEEKSHEILFPSNPGSVYHLTKVQDHLAFSFFNKNNKLRITDLHQGIVWGTQTEETKLDDDLVNRFDYDGDFGTVLNRFLVQSVVGYPLTVHGSGGQTRAFIHIQDMVHCVRHAIENPAADNSRVRIINQMTEVHTVVELAKKVASLTDAEIGYVDNPRKEAEKNDLYVDNSTVASFRQNPIMLNDELLTEVTDIVGRYKDRCDLSRIPCLSTW